VLERLISCGVADGLQQFVHRDGRIVVRRACRALGLGAALVCSNPTLIAKRAHRGTGAHGIPRMTSFPLQSHGRL